MCSLKMEEHFNSFQIIDTEPKLDKWNFLKVICSVVSENMSMNLQYYIKIYRSVLCLDGFLTHSGFYTMHQAFRKILIHCVMQTFQMSIYHYTRFKKKLHLLVSSLSQQKSLLVLEAVKLVVVKQVSQILTFTWKFELYHWQQIPSVISFIYKKMSPK